MTDQFPLRTKPETSPGNLSDVDLDRGMQLISRVILATFVGLGLLGIGFTILAFSQQKWQIWTLMTIIWIAFAVTGLTRSRLVSSIPLKLILIQAAVSLVMILVAGMVENTSLFASPVILAFSILLASMVSGSFDTSRIINVGIFLAVSASLVDVFALLNQAQSQEIQIFLAIILIITLTSFAYLNYRKIISLSMRIKLVVAGVVVALIPLVIISVFQAGFMTSSVTSTTNQSLQFAALSS